MYNHFFYQKYVERWVAKNLNKEKEANEEGNDETEEAADDKEKTSHQHSLQEANVEHPPDKSAAEREKLEKEKHEKEKLETEKENKINEKKHLTIPVATMSTALEATQCYKQDGRGANFGSNLCRLKMDSEYEFIMSSNSFNNKVL